MNNRLWKISGLVVLLALLGLSSCRGPKPVPQPEPGTFKPLLKVVEGKLAEMPEPFLGFEQNQDACKAWENNYPSQKMEETPSKITYITGDPDNYNPQRIYLFGTKGLATSILEVKASLVFTDGTEINESFEKLLYDKGYTEQKVSGKTIYSNGIVQLLVERNKDNKELALLTYTPTKSKLQDTNDFPLLIAQKAPKNYTVAEIKKYEQNLGIRQLKSETTEKIVFETPKSEYSKYNIHSIEYAFKEKYSADGLITARLYNIKNIEVFTSESFKEYLKAHKFEFEEKKEVAGVPFVLFKNEELKYRIRASLSIGNEYAILQFEYDPLMKGDDPGVTPQNDWEQFYLPFFEFGQEISQTGVVAQKEKARKFEVSYKADGSDQYGPITEQLMARRPFNTKDPYFGSFAKEPGFDSFTYTKAKGDANHKITVINMAFNQVWEKQKLDGEYPALKTFLTKNGFEFKESINVDETVAGIPTKGKITFYYDAKNKVQLRVAALTAFGFMAVSEFTHAETYQNDKALFLDRFMQKRLRK